MHLSAYSIATHQVIINGNGTVSVSKMGEYDIKVIWLLMNDFPTRFSLATERSISPSDSSVESKSENIKFAIVTADKDILGQNSDV